MAQLNEICFQHDCAATTACRDDQFQCADTGLCIPTDYICDEIEDCGDMSDEANCSELYFVLNSALCCSMQFMSTEKNVGDTILASIVNLKCYAWTK